MKIEDKSIHIGNKNKIKNSNIGNSIIKSTERQKWYSKIAWNIIVPIIVGVAVVAICVWLGLEN